MTDKRTIEIPWDEVSRIISREIEQVLGVKIQFKITVSED